MAVEELVKSINRLSWAISLLAMQQLGNSMSLLTRQNDFLQLRPAHAAGISGLTDGNAIAAQPGMLGRSMFRTGLELMHQAADILKSFNSGPDSRIVWQEFQNKLEAFSLFEQVDSELRISQHTAEPLVELVERARSHDSYRSVWLMEGLGHYYSDLHLRRGELPSLAECESLPAASLVPLHAGMSLSLAEWLLPSIEQNPSAALQVFIEICRNSSCPGYFGVTCEALGLATRNLYPHLLLQIDQSLSAFSEELVAYFWHGVGRAIYFSPSNFLPWLIVPWQGLQSSLSGPPHSPGRENAVAGFCWALTLVNVRHPEIIEAFLQHHANVLSGNDAAVNGVGSALAIWLQATSSSRSLDALRQYQPSASAAAIWRTHVQQNCEEALKRSGTHDAMGELFRYRGAGDWAQRGHHQAGGYAQNPTAETTAQATWDAIISRAAHALLRPQPPAQRTEDNPYPRGSQR
ncbi:MAG: hypothetical protein DMG65_11730 [Candidatus Angelobacter sp. Gp1-AA117]|nr:MAG: hypothetical protein DMG65_11730 [Candidatus Angelobacter sp. Gp1-AA117]